MMMLTKPSALLGLLLVNASTSTLAFLPSNCLDSNVKHMPVTGTPTTSFRSATANNDIIAPSSQFPLEFFKTPGDSKTPHNFGPASPLDTILYTAERPGNPTSKEGTATTEQVENWISYIRSKGITNVIALLDDNEFGVYEGEASGLLKLYELGGMKCYVKPMGEEDASSEILQIIEQAEKRGEKVVTHCTGGIGRAGRVAAAWLVHRYDLSPEVATLIALDQASKSGVKRLGHTQKLSDWLKYMY